MIYKRLIPTICILGALCIGFGAPDRAHGEALCATYNASTGTLHIPSLDAGDSFYRLDFQYSGGSFLLTDYGSAEATSLPATWNAADAILHAPAVDVESGTTYRVDLSFAEGNEFIVTGLGENSGSLALNEVVAKDEEGGNDWIEVYAVGNEPVNLGDYALIDDDPDHETASLPQVTLQPGEYYVIQATDEAPEDGSAFVPFKLGSDDGVALYNGETLVDVLDWEDGEAGSGESYGRLPNGTGVPQTLVPTAGAANAEGTGDTGNEDETVTRPSGWTDRTHSKTADPDYDTVFPANEVKRIDLIFTPSDWQAMLDDMTELFGTFGSSTNQRPGNGGAPPAGPGQMIPPTTPGNSFPDTNPVWKPCTLTFEGNTWNYAGVRFKGNSSLSGTWQSGNYKLPLRLDLDQFEDTYPEIDDQRFYGFKKLSLSSNYNDDSLIREKVMPEIFRAAGVPAPRTAFYRLYVDYGEGPLYFGLYTMVEIPEEPLFDEQFQKDDGNLYKPDGTGSAFAVYDEESMDKETNEDEADYSDVKALFDSLHASRDDAGTWRNGLESVFDVDGFLRWLAVNTLTQNWDTYGMMTHNYYLYNDPGDGLIHWIPWDNNESLGVNTRTPLSLELSSREVGDDWPLIRYLMDDPTYRATYVNYVSQAAQSVFNSTTMEPIYTEAHSLIRSYVVGAEGEQSGYTHVSGEAAFDAALNELKSHVQARYNAAVEFAGSVQ